MIPSNDCDSYTCTLSKKYREKAEKELGETEAKINEGLEAMREWVRKNPEVQMCRMGTYQTIKK